MLLKNKILLIVLLVVSTHSFSQKLNELLKGKTNLNEIKTIADNYFNENKFEENKKNEYDDNELVKYKRKEWYWQHRVNEDGTMPDMNKQYEIYKSLNNLTTNKNTRATTWKNISQTTAQGGYSDMGRVIAMAFHPTDTNIFYIGSPIGGIWKTTTGGNSWTPLGDNLPYCSVGNIAVDFVNPSTLYITIGENEGWWQYGLGVYKSTDGGLTWNPTSQVSNFVDGIVYYKLMIDPSNHNILYSAQSNGFWKSIDAGVTWSLINSNECIDFEFKPQHSSTIYLSKKNGSCEVYKSTNAGATWSPITSFGIANSDIEIGVTMADSNYIGMGINEIGNTSYYYSNDGAVTPFILQNNTIDDNAIIQISALNKNKIYCGSVSNYRTVDNGATWNQYTNWYNNGVLPEVHADNHFSAINPLKPQYVYFCNDGGLYRLNEQNEQWKDLSNGLIITQFYKIAHSQQDSVFLIGGSQDNGGRKRVSINNWDATNGGDGMEVAVNPINDQTMYTTYWGGTLYRSYDQWVNDTYFEITPDTNKGAWVTPYLLDYTNPSRIVAGYADVWISNDEGSSWNQISTNLVGTNNKIEVLDVARKNSNKIYAGVGSKIYYTANFGNTWSTKIIPGSTSFFASASQVLVHPFDENTVYVTKSGYAAGSKIYKSINNGTNWTNITFNIPNVPVNCITIDVKSDSTNVDMYIGTDIGVFYKKELDTTWQYYGTGMPNTQVSDLEIFYLTGKLRAATFGRGVFEMDIARHITPLSVSNILETGNKVSLQTNPVTDELIINITLAKSQTMDITIIDEAGKIIKNVQQNMPEGKSIYTIPVTNLSNSIYFLEVKNANNWHQTIKFIKQ